MTDGKYDTFWASKTIKGASIEFRLGKTQEISRLMLQEYIPLGQRVKAFTVYYLQDKNWVKLNQKEETTTIGYKRILRFDRIKTNGLRIVFMMPEVALASTILLPTKQIEISVRQI